MNGTMTSYFKIWEIKEDEGGKTATVRMSTNRKVKEEFARDKALVDNGIAKNGYVSTSWSFVRFVGKAYNKLMKDVKEGDSITNVECTIEREPYMDSKTNQVVYPNNIRMTVFSFDLANNGGNTSKNMDKAPMVAKNDTIEEDEEPF